MQKRGKSSLLHIQNSLMFRFRTFQNEKFLDVNFDGCFQYPIAILCFLCLKEKNSVLWACIRRNLLFILTFLCACVNINKY